MPVGCLPSALLALRSFALVHLHLGLKISHFGTTPRNMDIMEGNLARRAVRKDGHVKEFLQRAALARRRRVRGTMEPANRSNREFAGSRSDRSVR